MKIVGREDAIRGRPAAPREGVGKRFQVSPRQSRDADEEEQIRRPGGVSLLPRGPNAGAAYISSPSASRSERPMTRACSGASFLIPGDTWPIGTEDRVRRLARICSYLASS